MLRRLHPKRSSADLYAFSAPGWGITRFHLVIIAASFCLRSEGCAMAKAQNVAVVCAGVGGLAAPNVLRQHG
jgi:hypothetical protein